VKVTVDGIGCSIGPLRSTAAKAKDAACRHWLGEYVGRERMAGSGLLHVVEDEYALADYQACIKRLCFMSQWASATKLCCKVGKQVQGVNTDLRPLFHTLLFHLGRNGRHQEALSLVRKMSGFGVTPKTQTWNYVMNALLA
ncbi:unnamed protein product, partial [Chrysoparadoxa australica]